MDLSGSRSISAWIKPATQNTEYNIIVAKYYRRYSIFTDNGKLRGFIASSPSASSISNEDITVGEWQHVAMTFDYNGDKKIRLYINGDEVTYSTQTAMGGSYVSSYGYKFTIGSNRGTDRWFDGIIDEVKIYNKALSPTEIDNIYQSE